MSTTSNWRTIRDKRVGNDPGRVERAHEAMSAELQLASLRKHRRASQAAVAERLAVSQSNVSQFERSGDFKVSTLDSYVRALGGKLEILAVFDDETIPITTRLAARREQIKEIAERHRQALDLLAE